MADIWGYGQGIGWWNISFQSTRKMPGPWSNERLLKLCFYWILKDQPDEVVQWLMTHDMSKVTVLKSMGQYEIPVPKGQAQRLTFFESPTCQFQPMVGWWWIVAIDYPRIPWWKEGLYWDYMPEIVNHLHFITNQLLVEYWLYILYLCNTLGCPPLWVRVVKVCENPLAQTCKNPGGEYYWEGG